MKNSNKSAEGIKIVCSNRKASHDYHIIEKIEAGIVLAGTEVKSLREGKANLKDSYALIKDEEIYLLNCHISPYSPGAGKILLQQGQGNFFCTKKRYRG